MSNFQQRDNSGALFKNDKGDNPSRPDYRGDIMVDGQPYELAAWIKESAKGKFMSLSIKAKDAAAPSPPQRSAPPARGGGGNRQRDADNFDDSSIPF